MHSVLITGGTGTLGQALVRELMRRDVARICIFSRDELKQFEMREQITDPFKRLRWFLGDVRDADALHRAFNGIEYVIHAAAMKQVEACELNPLQAIKTNVDGSANVVNAALDRDVLDALAISTDKAEHPSTLYGATKLCAERIFQAANAYTGRGRTHFAALRLGNIAGSRGSVIPRWLALLKSGAGAVPVTDPECTRYWITAEDAAEFTLARLLAMQGGECFTPQMRAYRVGDLAEALGAKVRVTGLQPGEKLHEAGSELAPRIPISELRGLIAANC